MKFLVRQRVRVRIDDVPLPAAVEPHAGRFSEGLHERLRAGHARIVRVQHRHLFHAAPAPGRDDLFILVWPHRSIGVAIAPGRGHDDDLRVRPAGQVDEALHDAGAFERSAARNHERAFWRAVFLGRRQSGGEEGGEEHEARNPHEARSLHETWAHGRQSTAKLLRGRRRHLTCRPQPR